MAKIKSLVVIGTAITAMVVLFYCFMPVGFDWAHTFSKVWVNFQNPFGIASFTNPPWVIFFLPHALLPLKLGNAINATINILVLLLIVRKMGGGGLQYLIVFINPLFFDLMRTNNIDWLPGLAFLLPLGWWQLPMIVLKPQSIGLIALDWVRELYASRRKELIISLAVCLAIGLLSFIIWPNWIFLIKRDLGATSWNFAPFPLGIP